MPEALWEVQSLSKQIAEHVIYAVGSVGVRNESLDDLFAQRERVELSRGGLVVVSQGKFEHYKSKRKNQRYEAGDQMGELMYPDAPDPETPEYRSELAVVSRYVKGDSNYFDEDQSAHFVFEQNSNGVWKGIKLALAQAGYNAHTETRTYYLPNTEAISTKSQAAFVLALCQRFDEAGEKRAQAAVNWDNIIN